MKTTFQLLMDAIDAIKNNVHTFVIILEWENIECAYTHGGGFNEDYPSFVKQMWEYEEDPDVYGPGTSVTFEVVQMEDDIVLEVKFSA